MKPKIIRNFQRSKSFSDVDRNFTMITDYLNFEPDSVLISKNIAISYDTATDEIVVSKTTDGTEWTELRRI